MRMKLTFNSESPVALPVHYNHIIQGMIYSNLTQEFAEFLHECGFPWEKRRFKLFTFSRLEGRFRMAEGGRIEFEPPFHLTVSSPLERFLRELAGGLLKNDDLSLAGRRVVLENVTVYGPVEEPDFGDRIKIKMLSPVVAYKTLVEGEKKRTLYLTPLQEEFGELLRNNLLKKYAVLTGEEPGEPEFEIKPAFPLSEKYCKKIKYKDVIIKGWMGVYILRGDPALLKIAYDAGLGSKNSQGFGCFDILGRG
ncbi:CRISPR-associated endoribonuclease Cas6 [Thermosediminibacter litoriperuensis]|uniref:CRISPR-associated endoribonuclease n=1 Tax=Thermosediminibacter litoriperuensis TaxID=291989 RepID=A0A5S5AJ66_9FIRM|nr:CRISPR-associated endoribonuclease Cas6 [Thermosediminibacter litoriperuensis]TYP50859.1 CRISPR-associated Cas6 family protein [Thermosediminibacter litoriperuensis]